MKQNITVCFIFLLCTVSLFPVTTIDVESAVSRALEYNINLKMNAVDLSILKHTKDTGWNNFVPSVSLDASISRNNNGMAFTKTGAGGGTPVTEAERWSISAGVSAFITGLGASSFMNFQKNIRDYENGLITYESAVHKLELDVKKAFYDLLVQSEDIRISTIFLVNAEKKYRQDSENYRKGLVSEMVMLKSQLDYETAKNSIETKKVNYEAALATFRSFLGLDRGEDIVLSGDINPEVVVLDAEQLIADYLYQSIDVKPGLIRLEELRIQKTQQYISEYTPVFSASYGLSFGNIFDNPGFSDTGSFTLKLSIPLDSFIPGTKSNNIFYNNRKAVEKQELAVSAAVEAAKDKIYNSVLLINQSTSKIENLKLTELIAQRSYDLTYAAYMKGQVPWSDVSDASEALDSARQRVLAERYVYRSRLLDLEYLLNTKLTEH